MTAPLSAGNTADDTRARMRAMTRGLRDLLDGAAHLQDAVNALGAAQGGLAAVFADGDDVNNCAGAMLDIVGRIKGTRRDGDDGTGDKTYFPAMFWGA